MATVLMESHDGEFPSASAVLQVGATNAAYNRPALRIDRTSDSGGAASMNIFDPNPDFEFVESGAADAVHPARGVRDRSAVGRAPDQRPQGRQPRLRSHHGVPEAGGRLGAGGAGGNVGFRTGDRFGAGQGAIAIANAIAAPSVNPGGGGVLYVEGGALKYRGSQGTVTTIAAA